MKTKYLLFLPILFLLQSCIVTQKSLYNQEKKDNATVTKVNVPMFLVKPFIKKALREDGTSEEVIKLVKKIRKVKVYTVQNASEKMIADFSKESFGSNLQEFMSVNSKDAKIKILSEETNNPSVIKNLLISISDNKELLYVKIKGKFSLDDIAKIAELSEKNKNSLAKNND
jgi:hypothetical protein